MEASDVHKLERHLRRDISLVVGGTLLGLGIDEFVWGGFNIGTLTLVIAVLVLVWAWRMKR